jgi:hypothetical protein
MNISDLHRRLLVKRGLPTEFIFTVKTDNAGTSGTDQFTLPTTGFSWDCLVQWGDGTSDSYVGTMGSPTHTYPSVGTYEIKISGIGNRIFFNNTGDRRKVLEIKNWGNMVWNGSLGNFFRGCSNLDVTATDFPKFNNTNTSILNFFASCSNLQNTNGSLSTWQVEDVTTFDGCLSQCNLFNQSLGTWFLRPTSTIIFMLDVSNATIGTNLQEGYSRTLIGWANNIFSRGGVVTGRSLGANNRRYNNINYVSGQQFNNAVDARDYLVNTLGWTITGDALI